MQRYKDLYEQLRISRLLSEELPVTSAHLLVIL